MGFYLPRGCAMAPMAAVALTTWVACYQVPTTGTAGDFTSSPVISGNTVTTLVPTADANTPSNGNQSGPNPTSNIGTMTVAPASNPYLCLGAASATGGTPITLSTCTQSPNQLWMLSGGRLMLTAKLCLTPASEGATAVDSTPLLANCNPNNMEQVLTRGSTAGFVLNTIGASLALTAAVPTSSTSAVTLGTLDPNSLGQKWLLGLDNAATGTLQTGGMHITPVLAPTRCLSGDANGIVFAPCDQTAVQSWRWNSVAQITNAGGCLTAKAGAVAAMATCTGDSNQKWLSFNGQLANVGTAGCLDVDAGAAVPAKSQTPTPLSLVTCPTDTSERMVVGGPPLQ